MRKFNVIILSFMLAFPPVIASAKGKKVTICHKGKTITVAESAVEAHRRHGDTLGPCRQSQPEERQPDRERHGDFRLDHDFRPHTGDREFDDLLIELNRTAGRRIDQYIIDLSSAFNVSRKKVVFLIYNERMQPADAFMILQAARISGRPYQKLIPIFQQHRRQGWGTVIISLGIKPRSRTFLLLRDDVPRIIRHYVVRWEERSGWEKGSKQKKGSKPQKGSKRKKGSKKKR